MPRRPVTTDYLVEKDTRDPAYYRVIRRATWNGRFVHRFVVGHHDRHVAESAAANLRAAIRYENGPS